MTVFVNDVLRVAAEGNLGAAGQAVVNVFHYEATTVLDGNDTTVGLELTTQINLAWDALLSTLSTEWKMTNYSIVNVTQDVLLDDVVTSKTGTGVSDLLPSQVSALVLGRTATLRVQGRKFLGGMAEVNQGFGGQWDAPAITALQAFADIYIAQFTGLSGNVYDAGVWRPATLIPPAPALFTPFTGRKVVVNARTQRSRTQTLGFG